MKLFKIIKKATAILLEILIVTPVLFVVMLYSIGDYIVKLSK